MAIRQNYLYEPSGSISVRRLRTCSPDNTMKIKNALFTVMLALSCTRAEAQDRHDIESKYGKRLDVYSVGERLWMTPTYDSSGKVCLMRVYPKIISRNTDYPGADLDLNDALKFINESFPFNTRGPRAGDFGLSDLGGGIIWTKFYYEHIRFIFISTFSLTRKADGAIDLGDAG